MTEKTVLNLWKMRLVLVQVWSLVSYKIRWVVKFGKKPRNENSVLSEEQETQKRKAVVFAQGFMVGARWNIMRRQLNPEDDTELEEFNKWLKRNYPDVEFPRGIC